MTSASAPADAPRRRRATRGRAAVAMAVAALLALGIQPSGAGAAADPRTPAPTTIAMMAGPSEQAQTAAVEIDLPRPLNGRAAVRALADDLPVAAELNDRSSAELRALLVEDPSMWVDESGRLFVKDTLEDPAPRQGHRHDSTASTASTEGTARRAQAPLSQTFDLHSLPGSSKTIFLDFDGHRLSQTLWNRVDGVPDATYEGWDPAGDGPGFSDSELALVQEIWAHVAEDYAPYDVNVTTADPGEAALVRTSTSDQQYGMRAFFTDSTALFDTVGGGFTVGVAYLGVFGGIRGPQVESALVFTSQMGADAAMVADVASHEVGHTLNLEHVDNLPGVRPATRLYGPVMTSQVTRSAVTQWTRPDLAGIAAAGLLPRSDEAGDSPATASPLTDTLVTGVISSGGDQDWYRIEGCTTLGVTATAAEVGPNLDLTLRLVDAGGATVAFDAPATSLRDGVAQGLGASLTRPLSGAVHHLVVAGGGDGAGGVSGDYDATGSMGAYTLDVSGCSSEQTTPSAPRSVQAHTDQTGTTTVTWDTPAHAGGSPITGYEVKVGTAPAARVGAAARSSRVTSGQRRPRVSVRAHNALGWSAAVTVTSYAAPSAPRTASLLLAPAEWEYDSRFRLLRFSGHDDGGMALSGVSLRLDSPTGHQILDDADPQGEWVMPLGSDHDGRLAWIQLSNPAGTGPWKSFVIRPRAVVPTAPTHPTVSHDSAGERLTFTWRAPQDDGGAGYDYRVRVDGGRWSTLDAATTTWHVPGARPRDQHFEVRAVNSAGAGPSAQVVAVPAGATRPGKGRITRVKAGKRGGKKTVTVRWSATRSTGGTQLTGHRLVVQRLDKRGKVARTTRTKIWAAGQRSQQLRLAKKGRYRFAVESRNVLGWGKRSAWSKKVTPR